MIIPKCPDVGTMRGVVCLAGLLWLVPAMVLGQSGMVVENWQSEFPVPLAVDGLKDGVAWFEQGKFRQAQEAFQSAVDRGKGGPEAFVNLGLTFLRLGETANAERVFRLGLERHAEHAGLHNLLGNLLFQGKRLPEALEYLRKAVRLDPRKPQYLTNLGVAFGKQGRKIEATELFRRAVVLDAGYVPAHLNLGVVVSEGGDFQAAQASVLEAIRLDPLNPRAHLLHGIFLNELERNDEAQEALKMAIQLRPDWPEAHFSLGVACVTGRDRFSALEQYKILQKLHPELAKKLFRVIYPR